VSYSFTTLFTSSGGNSDNILKLNKLRCSYLSQVNSHMPRIREARDKSSDFGFWVGKEEADPRREGRKEKRSGSSPF
jgi:hypothetical protein